MNKRSGTVLLGTLVVSTCTLAWPGLASAASCTIAPSAPTVEQGGKVTWSATVTGFSRTPNYSWTFGGGSLTSSTSRTPTVTYNTVGTNPYTTSLRVSRGGTSATCTTTVTVTKPRPVAPQVSINSTSQNSKDVGVDPYKLGAVPESTRPNSANSLTPATGTGTTVYQVLAINDLGMHCGDLDTRIASILPPFQALLSQVILKGAEPRILNKLTDGIDVTYSAASNPSDPILGVATDAKTGYPFTGLTKNYDVFKTNFWSVVSAYQPFYPPIVKIDATTVGPDTGLIVPNVEDLYIGGDGLVNSGDEELIAVQHAMPGIASPYRANAAEVAEEFFTDKPFFVNFPFGYVANDVNWFEGAGIPFAAFDDFGRENPYPLVRVQAKKGSQVLATVDTVLPISGEASCKNCHGSPVDVDSPATEGSATKKLSDNQLPVASTLDDPQLGKDVPLSASVEYATDINILRLHDYLHGAEYRNGDGTATVCTVTAANPNGDANCLVNKALVQKKPVVCQVCHYTPALDLAHVGPLGGVPNDTDANGRVQRIHQSNSRVLHMGHAKHTSLFPQMPPPASDSSTNGLPSNQAQREQILEQTCYSCHPGNKTKCMRGAMADGGMVCQDCHGDMDKVGNDFTAGMDATHPFPQGIDLTKRVPWANEPGCGSCHTGDATSNLAKATGARVNGFDTSGNADGIRLIRAYLDGDAATTAKPIVPANKRFAENTVPADFNGFANPGAGNPKLYRVSTGHGGVMCEGCHGATHAEWDTDGSPLTNDNVTAGQLQGHSGTVSECSTCHVTSGIPADTQGGPHGMHLVNDSRFINGEGDRNHKKLAKNENGKPGGGSCGACHGSDHKGTVLSRTPVDRNYGPFEEFPSNVQAGEPVACDVCHTLAKSFGSD